MTPLLAWCALLPAGHTAAALEAPILTVKEALSYPFVSQLATAESRDCMAWIRNVNGVRNIWLAQGPDFTPRQITHEETDDGQELTQLTFSPDCRHLVYVRGGDHTGNWPAEGHFAPNPAGTAEQPEVTVWAASLVGKAPTRIAAGDAPAISRSGQLAYLENDQVWTASLAGNGAARRLFFDRGHDDALQWSPEGTRLAFVSNRGDHALVGVFDLKGQAVSFPAPSTGWDHSPRWSPDGSRIAFVRTPGVGGDPAPILTEAPQPWSLWVATVADGEGHRVWNSPLTPEGSLSDIAREPLLFWGAGERLVFVAELDNWPHLYSIPAGGGQPTLLTPGSFMVEHAAMSRDRRFVVYDANTGNTVDDRDRRHIFRVPVDRATPRAITAGESLEWTPVGVGDDRVGFIDSGPRKPPTVAVADIDGRGRRELTASGLRSSFPSDELVTPRSVHFSAADGVTVYGQLFQPDDGSGSKPALIYVHGGPHQQMLLGWHYMEPFSEHYAMNEYLARHGFTVLCVNYRQSTGYGRAFEHPEHAGRAGASEYQDVLAAAGFLRHLHGVDPQRIGILGESYGGYLTALGLARDSEIFKAGVDIAGVADWSHFIVNDHPVVRFETGDRNQALYTAWASSPVSSIDHWTSPVLLLHGDDDRNVQFQYTVDLARRLEARHVSFEEVVIPNETHVFLRHQSWVRADEATSDFLFKTFGVSR